MFWSWTFTHLVLQCWLTKVGTQLTKKYTYILKKDTKMNMIMNIVWKNKFYLEGVQANSKLAKKVTISRKSTILIKLSLYSSNIVTLPTHEVVMLNKFHDDREKIVDFYKYHISGLLTFLISHTVVLIEGCTQKFMLYSSVPNM